MTERPDIGERLPEHVAALRRYALVLTRNRDDAEDLVQECLAKAIAAAHTWKPELDLRVWLFRILHNLHVSDLRKRKVRQTARIDLPDPVVEADQPMRVEVRQVLDALEQLPEAQRRPIVLVALEEMSYAEAADALGVPMGTLFSRLGRGREALRRIVNEARSTTRLRLVV